MLASKATRMKTSDLAYIAMFAAIMAVCSWISIPATVPFTLQTFGVFLAVGVLGGKRGTLAVLIYLLLGAVGAPVFAGFAGGVGCLMGSTGGYIVGFLLSALIMWGMEHLFGRRKWSLAFSMVLGLLVCYAFGTVWYIFVYTSNTGTIGIFTALAWCVFPFVIPDIIKIVLALAICEKLARACRLY